MEAHRVRGSQAEDRHEAIHLDGWAAGQLHKAARRRRCSALMQDRSSGRTVAATGAVCKFGHVVNSRPSPDLGCCLPTGSDLGCRLPGTGAVRCLRPSNGALRCRLPRAGALRCCLVTARGGFCDPSHPCSSLVSAGQLNSPREPRELRCNAGSRQWRCRSADSFARAQLRCDEAAERLQERWAAGGGAALARYVCCCQQQRAGALLATCMVLS